MFPAFGAPSTGNILLCLIAVKMAIFLAIFLFCAQLVITLSLQLPGRIRAREQMPETYSRVNIFQGFLLTFLSLPFYSP